MSALATAERGPLEGCRVNYNLVAAAGSAILPYQFSSPTNLAALPFYIKKAALPNGEARPFINQGVTN